MLSRLRRHYRRPPTTGRTAWDQSPVRGLTPASIRLLPVTSFSLPRARTRVIRSRTGSLVLFYGGYLRCFGAACHWRLVLAWLYRGVRAATSLSSVLVFFLAHTRSHGCTFPPKHGRAESGLYFSR